MVKLSENIMNVLANTFYIYEDDMVRCQLPFMNQISNFFKKKKKEAIRSRPRLYLYDEQPIRLSKTYHNSLNNYVSKRFAFFASHTYRFPKKHDRKGKGKEVCREDYDDYRPFKPLMHKRANLYLPPAQSMQIYDWKDLYDTHWSGSSRDRCFDVSDDYYDKSKRDLLYSLSTPYQVSPYRNSPFDYSLYKSPYIDEPDKSKSMIEINMATPVKAHLRDINSYYAAARMFIGKKAYLSKFELLNTKSNDKNLGEIELKPLRIRTTPVIG